MKITRSAFITRVTPDMFVPSLVISGHEWMHWRLTQLDLLHFWSPEPLLSCYSHRRGPISLHYLLNAADSKPAGGGVRLGSCRSPMKKGRASDCCRTAAPLVKTPKAGWMQNAVLRWGVSLASLGWILLPTLALKMCLCVTAGGLRLSLKANSKKQPK